MKKIISSLALTSTILIYSQVAYAEQSASDRYFYIGGELGISEPLIKAFEHEESKTKIRLKKSEMLGAKVGYSFYPNMMIELSGTYQPTFKLAYKLPETPVPIPGMPGVAIPETPGKTKVYANVYTLNLVYEADPLAAIAGIKPYVIFGAGVTKVVVKPTTSDWKSPLPFGDITYFKIRKTTTYCPTWQAGVGFGRDLADNFSVDISAKLQVVHNIKINYDTLDMRTFLTTGGVTKTFNPANPIKKTIGVGEFALGFTYKLPF